MRGDTTPESSLVTADRPGDWLTRNPARRRWLVAGLLAFFVFHALLGARTHTPTVDEFVQVPMGYYYLKTGRYDLDRRNPPLIKTLSAIPLAVLNAKLDSDPQWRGRGEGWWMWVYATRFMRINADRYLDLFFAARTVNVLLGALCGWCVYVWTRRLFGITAAVGALFLFCTAPVIIGHASVATLDIGVTLFIFAGFAALDRASRASGWKWMAATGALFGAALASKYVTLLVLPLIPLLLVLDWKPGNARDRIRYLKAVAVMTFFGWLAFNAAFGFRGMPLPDEMMEGILYKTGEMMEGRSLSYLLGNWSTHGWWYYYLVAIFYKSTIPFLLLLLAGGYCFMRGPFKPPLGWRRYESLRPLLWIGLPPLVLLYALSFHYRISFGIRYLLPAIPFLTMLAGCGIAGLLRGARMERVAVIILLLWESAACVLTSPAHLSYFNEAAGGPALARNILLDSNFDWGQDLGRLKQLMDREGIKKIRLGYFGHVDPALYGIDYELPPPEPEPGVYAISATYLAGFPPAITYRKGTRVFLPRGHWDWLDQYEPIACAGDTIFLYQITDREAEPR